MTQSGPFHVGPGERPAIKHDNGFLDQFSAQRPTLEDQLSPFKVAGRMNSKDSEGVVPHLADANAAYRHFLDGAGADRKFSYERYVESDPSGAKTSRI